VASPVNLISARTRMARISACTLPLRLQRVVPSTSRRELLKVGGAAGCQAAEHRWDPARLAVVKYADRFVRRRLTLQDEV
jgi:hypothetical protein